MGEPVTLHPPYTEADREAAFEAWRTAAGRSHARLARLTGLSRETVHTWATRYDWPRRARALDAEEAGGALLSAAAIVRRHLLGAVQVNVDCMLDAHAHWKDRLNAAQWLAGTVGVSPVAKQAVLSQRLAEPAAVDDLGDLASLTTEEKVARLRRLQAGDGGRGWAG